MRFYLLSNRAFCGMHRKGVPAVPQDFGGVLHALQLVARERRHVRGITVPARFFGGFPRFLPTLFSNGFCHRGWPAYFGTTLSMDAFAFVSGPESTALGVSGYIPLSTTQGVNTLPGTIFRKVLPGKVASSY